MEFEEIKDWEYKIYFRNSHGEESSVSLNIREKAESLGACDGELNFEELLKTAIVNKIEQVDGKIDSSDQQEFENFVHGTIKAFKFFYKSNKNRVVKFCTGESLTVEDDGYKINLIPEKYPVSWHELEWERYLYGGSCIEYAKSNTDDQFYITEISKSDDKHWKLEIILHSYYNDRRILSIRFKFFVKENDVLRFKYYKDENLYSVDAIVSKIDYNTIELSIKGIAKPFKYYPIHPKRAKDPGEFSDL